MGDEIDYPLPLITMMTFINLTEVASYTFREFLEEEYVDMVMLYQIAEEVNRQNEEAMNSGGKSEEDKDNPDSYEQIKFFESMREDR